MKVISIGTDKKVLEEGSTVWRRIKAYEKLFEKFDIVLFSKISDYLKLRKVGKLISPDTVVTTQDPFETGLFGLLLKLFYGAPLQIQLHTDFRNRYFLFSSPLNFIRFFLGHLTLPFADAVRVVSERVAKSIKILNKNIVVLPIYIESESLRGASYKVEERKTKNILTVCRLEKEKDLVTAIKAFKIVSERFPDATFTVVGDGSQRKHLEDLSKNYNLTSKIYFVGWQNNLEKFYANTDIYISTSLYEGYGMSIVEAALAGCALVISDTGVAGELPALVSRPKDIKGFALSLEKLLSEEDLAREMGEKAKNDALALIIAKDEYMRKYKEATESAIKKMQ